MKRPICKVSGHDDAFDAPADKRNLNQPKTSVSESLPLSLPVSPSVPTHLPGASTEDTVTRHDGILSTETSELGSMVK